MSFNLMSEKTTFACYIASMVFVTLLTISCGVLPPCTAIIFDVVILILFTPILIKINKYNGD